MTAKESRFRSSMSSSPSGNHRSSDRDWFIADLTRRLDDTREPQLSDDNSTVAVAAKAAGVPSLDDLRRLSEEIRRAPYWMNE